MIDHTGVTVSDYSKSLAFYTAALGAIGIVKIMEIPASVTGDTDVAGFGPPGKAEFWIGRGTPNHPPIHIAFRVDSRAAVDAFYQAAIAVGARDNGAPGIRAYYHPDYYGAYVLDPDGHNIEAVCHLPG
ncbi:MULTISPECIES: VOC family protein [Paraburkholderia]|uniref:VOC family protein n=1 Tax=Paraburkholderia TaxID=1822464 RepID=UPI00224DBF9E|nr:MULTISPECIES: VOC family protein [Paraburkholderia]MCX4163470.1 VOC family protein [Paraburkholderia megapolitana]MDN7158965.1 VOC family protein [Paraburkholderia sp. CHISQ3]MDQ6496012.1 VOC family protein [Paraburkholderia megapolitana]